MDVLRELVRSLAVLIILTSFLEMILPNTKMKSYTRLVLGLFVIVIILNPVLSFLDSHNNYSSQAWSAPVQNGELDAILEDAQDLTVQSQESAVTEYTRRVGQQIAALVRLAPEISDAEVEVHLDLEGNSLQSASGAIKKVAITAKVKEGDSIGNSRDSQAGVPETDIKVSGSEILEQNAKSAQEQTERRIQSIVGDFYGLTAEQVSVTLEN